jgi:hypothetical protein
MTIGTTNSGISDQLKYTPYAGSAGISNDELCGYMKSDVIGVLYRKQILPIILMPEM